MITERDMQRIAAASNDSENPKDRIGAGRPPLHLIPPAAEIAESVVMALGAKKYGVANWRRSKVKASIYIAAARRHLAQWFDGQDEDPESGVTHVAHARACLGILLDALATGHLVDDRPPPGAASELMERFSSGNSGGGNAAAMTPDGGKPVERPETVELVSRFVEPPTAEEIPTTTQLVFSLGSFASRMRQSGYLSADQVDELSAWLTEHVHLPAAEVAALIWQQQAAEE